MAAGGANCFGRPFDYTGFAPGIRCRTSAVFYLASALIDMGRRVFFFAVNAVAARQFLLDLGLYCAIFWISCRFQKSAYSALLIEVLLILVFLTCLYGLHQKFISFPRTLEVMMQSDEPATQVGLNRIQSGRIFSTFRHVNTFAGFLVMLMPLAVGRLVQSQSKPLRLWYASVLILQLLCLYYTKSVGALATLAVLFLISAYWIHRLNMPKLQHRHSVIIGILALVGILGTFVIFLNSRTDFVLDITKAGSLSWRLENWRIGWHIFLDHPLMGVGPGCYGAAYIGYMTAAANESRYAHNAWIQLLAELGLPGGLLWLIFTLAAIYSLRLYLKTPTFQTALALSFLGYLIHNLVDFDLYFSSISIPAFMLLGLVAPAGVETAPQSPGRRRFMMGMVILISIPLFFKNLAIARAKSDVRLAAAARVKNDYQTAYRYYLQACEKDPYDARTLASLAELNWILTPTEANRSIEYLQKAIRYDQRNPVYYFQLSQLYLVRNDYPQAEAALVTASRLYPLNANFRIALDSLRVWNPQSSSPP